MSSLWEKADVLARDFVPVALNGNCSKTLPFGIGFELVAAEQPMDRIAPAHYSPTYYK